MAAPEDREWLYAGRVGAPHGLDGSVHVTDPSPRLLELGVTVRLGGGDDDRRAGAGAVRTIERRAGHDRGVIVRLSGCTDRAAAEALRGLELSVPRAGAPPLEEDEWWAEDLEGCAVHDGERPIGVVRRLLALPSCEVLEVERSAGAGDLLVPLVEDAVREVDVEARRIDIDLAFLGE